MRSLKIYRTYIITIKFFNYNLINRFSLLCFTYFTVNSLIKYKYNRSKKKIIFLQMVIFLMKFNIAFSLK